MNVSVMAWDNDQDRLRDYIIRRASNGARLTREANEAQRAMEEIEALEEKQREAAIAEQQRIKAEALALERAAYIPTRHEAKHIVREILTHRKVHPREIDSAQRTQRISWCRQEIAYWLRVNTKLGLYGIASRIGVADHSTVLYGIKTYAKRHGLEVPK